MKALILAAGFGSRLMPLTQNTPKCLVEYKGAKILDYELKALREAGIGEIGIVGGYLFDTIKEYASGQGICHIYQNTNFARTNMVTTLFCAYEFLQKCIDDKEDVLISYADIIYSQEIIRSLVGCKKDFAIAVDMGWQDLWEKRFADILSDAETLKLDGEYIIELGKKPQSIEQIEGQYMGLFRFSAKFLPKILEFYKKLDRNVLYDGKDFDNMYMTSFLQALIDAGFRAHCVKNIWWWLEIDNLSDLEQ